MSDLVFKKEWVVKNPTNNDDTVAVYDQCDSVLFSDGTTWQILWMNNESGKRPIVGSEIRPSSKR